jgi:hypothetical protein
VTSKGRGSGVLPLLRALDDARFGPSRTLNLRNALPTAAQAVARAEAWLRERQASRAGELLIITGRGNQSEDGVSPVRTAVARLLVSLRRRGIIASMTEHTPGSFVVTPAPLKALREAPRRKREPRRVSLAEPATLLTLSPETRTILRRVAQGALRALGVRDSSRFLAKEMLEQFSLVARGVPDGPDRDARLHAALEALLRDYDDA